MPGAVIVSEFEQSALMPRLQHQGPFHCTCTILTAVSLLSGTSTLLQVMSLEVFIHYWQLAIALQKESSSGQAVLAMLHTLEFLFDSILGACIDHLTFQRS